MKDKSSPAAPNPQVEEQLDALVKLCWQSLQGHSSDLGSRSEPLLKSLLMSGYVRLYGRNISAELEKRVKAQYREQAMHRGGALSSIVAGIQKKINQLVQWESQQPGESTPSKAANISSATDS